MVAKTIFGLVAAFGLAGVGLSLAETRTGCCDPGAACCVPGSPCCDTPAATGSCCAPGADCCFPGSPCCAGDCCAPGAPCCVPGAACCDLTAASADVAPAPRAKADRKGGCSAGGCCAAADQPAPPAKADTATSKIAVNGMSCAGCAKTVGKAVSAVEGVESAVADVKTKTLTVIAKKGAAPSPKAMWEAVEKAGYTPTRIEGAAGTFDKKPEK
jgi:copper chaperone CopZ